MTSHVFIVSLLLFCFQPLDFLSSFPHHRHHSDVSACLEKYFFGRNHTILYVFVCLPNTSCESLAIKLRYLGVSVGEVSLFSGTVLCVCVCARTWIWKASENWKPVLKPRSSPLETLSENFARAVWEIELHLLGSPLPFRFLTAGFE